MKNIAKVSHHWTHNVILGSKWLYCDHCKKARKPPDTKLYSYEQVLAMQKKAFESASKKNSLAIPVTTSPQELSKE